MSGARLEWQGTDGARVFRDVLADAAVPARHRLREFPAMVIHRERESVQLQLGDVGESFLAQKIPHALIEVPQFGLVQRVIKGQHGARVRHFYEAFARLSPDPPGGRILARVLGMGLLQSLQFAHERVVFGVGNFGRVQHVIKILVVAQGLAELLDFLECGTHGALYSKHRELSAASPHLQSRRRKNPEGS